MHWREYEKTVFEHLKLEMLDSEIRWDVNLEGNLSLAKRQIDILVDENVSGEDSRIAVDAKRHSRPINVKQVEEFIGLLHDVGLERGVLVSAAGYSEAAFQRAFADDLDVDLDIFSLAEFKQWQGHFGIPYAGSHGVLVSAPLGWVIDAQQSSMGNARFYQRGLTLGGAIRRAEFLYINFWEKDAEANTLTELLERQTMQFKEAVPAGRITRLEYPPLRQHEACAIRYFESPTYPAVEVTGFVEFEYFIFFAVLFTPLLVQRRNVRKLERLLRRVCPIRLRTAPSSATC